MYLICGGLNWIILHFKLTSQYFSYIKIQFSLIKPMLWWFSDKFGGEIWPFFPLANLYFISISDLKFPNFLLSWFFSSPEHEVLKWAFVILQCLASGVRACVRACVNNFFKQHLLWNRLLDFYQTSQEWSLGGLLSKLFKPFHLVA